MARSKFLNKKVEIDGIKFDSLKESKFYLYYKNLENQRKISDLKLQVPFDCIINGKNCFKYFADFTFKDEAGKRHVIDVKSEFTAKDKVFRIKKKVIEALHGIEIELSI